MVLANFEDVVLRLIHRFAHVLRKVWTAEESGGGERIYRCTMKPCGWRAEKNLVQVTVELGFIEGLNCKIGVLQRHWTGGIIPRSHPLAGLLQTAQ